ncbi:MAG: HDIG domain-containing protein [Chloroflexi bacterium]|nr:HDIG domain-containing protein [Chloroflexota bacterium]
MRALSPPQVLLFGGVLAAALVVALFPFFPRQLQVDEGDVISRDIRSPRDQTFVSELLTQQARDDAAQAVPDVLVFDPNVSSDQLATFGANAALVSQVREADDLDAAAKRARLLSVLSRSGADTALSMADARWERVAREAEQALDATLGQSIAPDGAQAARDALLGQVSLDLSSEEADLVVDLVRRLVVPTLVVDDAATLAARDAARQSVEPVRQSIARGQLLVEAGQRIDATTIEVLDRVGLLTPRVQWRDVAAVVVMATIVAVVLASYLWIFPVAALGSLPRVLLLAVIVAVPVLIARIYFSLVLPDDSRRFLAYFLPLAAVPMLVASLLEARLALVIGLLQAALMMFSVVSLPDVALVEAIEPIDVGRVFIVYGLGTMAGVLAVHQAERPNQYALAGVLSGVAALAALFAYWLLDPERRAFDLVWMASAASVAGLSSGLLTAGGFSAVASLLGVTTRVQLMELSQLNAPLLRRLQDEAPGTFHHSIIVANLAERAAYLAGADALLVRVGCYYHDLGKVVQPAFYIENQLGGVNPHDGMDPRASARIIAQHVRAGLELARRHNLPRRVQDFIPEHHGTRLISYFYRLASQQDPNTEQSLFRYPGPRPQTRETAIVMLADSTEAVVRSSEDRSLERIDQLVEEVLAERVAEGELEECDLTLRDLRTIAESFKRTLRGVYHPRIAYPEPTEREQRALIGRFRPGRRLAPTPPPPFPEAPARPRRSQPSA